jgi:threonine aldolase
MRIVDLRSDTVTKPSPDMWECIRGMDNSMLGDDVISEDPTVNALEEKAAQITGKESALLVTSGTQGNLVSLLSQTNPGDRILLEELSHIYTNEVGGVARIGGLLISTYISDNGTPLVKKIAEMINDKDDIHRPPTTLIGIENTHNFHGGAIIEPDAIKEIQTFVLENNLKLHLDGARIFNAAVALDIPVTQITQYVDSVMFCLSKGLSCPVGSIVVGSKDFIQKARKYRKMLGGGMRQAGIIAAFGLVALEDKWIKRLGEDHKNAKRLAEGLRGYDLSMNIFPTDTNILIIELSGKFHILKIINALNKEGILAYNISKEKIRFVTHYGITEEDIDYSIEKIGEILKKHL